MKGETTMQLKDKVFALAAGATLVGGSLAGIVAAAMPASASPSLPNYTSNGFCSTQTVNAFHDVEVMKCTGNYVVNKSTYEFTQDAINACPKMGALADLSETWVSPPTGGSPTILASYHVSLS
jgi:hypothetical protein